MKKLYNLEKDKNQPCEPIWKELHFVGKVEDECLLFYVYYDASEDCILDYPETLEEKL